MPAAAPDRQIAALRLGELFRPGDYALLAHAGGYLHVYRCRLGERVDLARRRCDVTRAVAAALDLPLRHWGLDDVRTLELVQALGKAAPALAHVGYCQVYVDHVWYHLPDACGPPCRYRIWKDGRIETDKFQGGRD